MTPKRRVINLSWFFLLGTKVKKNFPSLSNAFLSNESYDEPRFSHYPLP